MLKRLIAPAIAAGFALSMLLPAPGADAAEKKDFKVCWSIYAGWMPWGHIQETGLMKKWAEKYGISVDIVQINDYVESINQYTAGAYDGCSMTNMDALSIPAGGGVDTTALIVGDYSNGNDGIVLKGKNKLADIKGQKVNRREVGLGLPVLIDVDAPRGGGVGTPHVGPAAFLAAGVRHQFSRFGQGLEIVSRREIHVTVDENSHG